jgi:hypothetical protein
MDTVKREVLEVLESAGKTDPPCLERERNARRNVLMHFPGALLLLLLFSAGPSSVG